MLEGRVDVEPQRGPGLEQQLGAEQWRVRRDRCRLAEQRPEEHPSLPPGAGHRVRGVVGEAGVDEAVRVRQRHPELGTVQRRGRGRRDLGVADASTGGHQVDLAGTHHRVVAGAVAVLDLAREQPAHGLQPRVRVRRDDHAAGVGDEVGPVVVDEAPRADQRAVPLRKGAAYPHGAGPAERDVARGHDLDPRRDRAGGRDLVGPVLEVAHSTSVPPGTSPESRPGAQLNWCGWTARLVSSPRPEGISVLASLAWVTPVGPPSEGSSRTTTDL